MPMAWAAGWHGVQVVLCALDHASYAGTARGLAAENRSYTCSSLAELSRTAECNANQQINGVPRPYLCSVVRARSKSICPEISGK